MASKQKTMKRQIIATTFLFILLSAGCRTGDPILGKWKKTTEAASQFEKIEELNNPPQREFLSDGTFYSGVLKGTWRRLDDRRLEIRTNLGRNLGASPSIETVIIEDDVATFTSADGRVSKWKRQGLW